MAERELPIVIGPVEILLTAFRHVILQFANRPTAAGAWRPAALASIRRC